MKVKRLAKEFNSYRRRSLRAKKQNLKVVLVRGDETTAKELESLLFGNGGSPFLTLLPENIPGDPAALLRTVQEYDAAVLATGPDMGFAEIAFILAAIADDLPFLIYTGNGAESGSTRELLTRLISEEEIQVYDDFSLEEFILRLTGELDEDAASILDASAVARDIYSRGLISGAATRNLWLAFLARGRKPAGAALAYGLAGLWVELNSLKGPGGAAETLIGSGVIYLATCAAQAAAKKTGKLLRLPESLTDMVTAYTWTFMLGNMMQLCLRLRKRKNGDG